MAKVKIATKKMTCGGCPTSFIGRVSVDGHLEDFELVYDGWSATVRTCGERLDAETVGTQSDGVCSWDNVKDGALAAMKEYFGGYAYQERRKAMFGEAA